MLIPLVSVLVATTLLPVILATIGAKLDWPHRRTDDRASRSWTRWAEAVSRRRWLAAGDGNEGLVALEEAGIGEGSLLPHEILVSGSTDPDEVARELRGVDGIHGAV